MPVEDANEQVPPNPLDELSQGEHSFDELARGLAGGAISRARAMRLVGAAIFGGALGFFSLPDEAEARRRRRRRGGRGRGGGGGGSTPTPPPPMPGPPTILGGEEYPIGLWWPPPPAHTTAQRYQEIAAAGFNFVIGGNHVTNDTYNPAALNAAGVNNLRFLLTDSEIQSIIRSSTDYSSAYLRIQQLMQRYGGYPALSGLNLYDEPNRSMFGILGYARAALQGLDSKKLPWANVFGYTTDPSLTGTSTYEEYLQLYLGEVEPPFLSFDHYPLLSGTEITRRYFDNWAIVRRFSLQAGIPSWGFIQSMDFRWTQNTYAPRRRPNEAELLWQVNVGLAYGAKGLQYFAYWTPTNSPNASVQFGEALVTVGGTLTPLYDYARRVNDYLRVVGKVLLPLTSESVVHAGEDPLPLGATAFSPDGYVESTSGSPVILSRFRQSAEAAERYLLVVNRSFTAEAQTQLTLYASVSEASKLDSSTGTFAKVEQQGTLQLRIEPGGARLYRLN